MPKTLALMAVQRQTAASRSARPPMRVQHGLFAGVPTTRFNKSFNKLAHTPSFNASIGHVVCPEGGTEPPPPVLGGAIGGDWIVGTDLGGVTGGIGTVGA
ncbi:hypothetical protein Leryth_001656 [Lithospermum erythrorhizon]|nr:hypothetical protein Leryth_001656 [Lithospermum erythrorhizon]